MNIFYQTLQAKIHKRVQFKSTLAARILGSLGAGVCVYSAWVEETARRKPGFKPHQESAGLDETALAETKKLPSLAYAVYCEMIS